MNPLEMSQILHPSTGPGDEIIVDVVLWRLMPCGGYHESGVYPCVAKIREISGGRMGDGYCIEIEMLAEHPLLTDNRMSTTIEGVLYELENMYIGEGYFLEVMVPDLLPSSELSHCDGQKRHKRKKRKLSTYEEAVIDPEIAARVLTTPDGIQTRQHFYPLKT